MANNPGDGTADDFLEQILGFPAYAGTDSNLAGNGAAAPMMLQLNSGDGSGQLSGGAGVGGGFHFPLGLSLEQGKGGFLKMDEASGSGNRFREDVDSRVSSSVKTGFHGQPMHNTLPAMPHPPAIRPRVRARRGQATDPHSIAERLRRERIAERIRALQELVPNVNKGRTKMGWGSSN